ncbi:unnamed protein product, partial [Prorocentrum cordatum]
SMSNPRVRDIANVHKAINMAKDDSEFEVTFTSAPDWDNAIAFGCGDSLADPLLGDELALVHICATIKRVRRGSLPAERNGFVTAAESAEFAKHVFAEILGAKFDPFVDSKEIAALADAGGLSSSFEKDGGQLKDKRVRILMARIREFMGHARVGADDRDRVDWQFSARWIDAKLMLFDAPLTKTESERGDPLERMAKSSWCLAPTDGMLGRKKAIGE